jgi:hypothetical protein
VLDAVVAWARRSPEIRAVVLVGSFARGSPSADSDVDLVLLGEDPARFVGDPSWAYAFGRVERLQIEPWGRVTSVRVWYHGGPEVEFGFTDSDWADDRDDGAVRVRRAGCIVVHDPSGLFSRSAGSPATVHLPNP